MRRREFIAGLGGAAVVGPRGAWAQPARIPRVGMLFASEEGDQELQGRLVGLKQGLEYTALRHCIAGVDRDIDQRRFKLGFIDYDWPSLTTLSLESGWRF